MRWQRCCEHRSELLACADRHYIEPWSTIIRRLAVGSLLALLVLAVSGCGLFPRTIAGSGVLVEEDRSLSPFRAVEVGGGIHATLAHGSQHEMQVRIDDNLQEFLVVDEQDGRLTIRMSNDVSVRSATLEVRITAPTIDTVRARGASRIDLEDPIEAPNISITSSGGSSVSGVVDGGRLDVTTSGSGTADLRANAEELQVGASGSSNSQIEGSATSVAITGSGSSETDLSGLSSETADVSLSGSSQATIGATDQLAFRVSGNSLLRFDGDPQITSDRRSGSASVEPLAPSG